VTYARNRNPGQWAAHGRYLSRESATQSEHGQGSGFDRETENRGIASTLGAWQQARDPRLFKLIISPEFGERLDLQGLTRGLMEKMEIDLGSRLEWIATVHRNTEYPHVHVALRGITEDGQPLHLPREYIKHGIRKIAEDLATAQLGYRTELDAQEAQRREIRQQRYTSLDRILKRAKENSDEGRPDVFLFDLSRRHGQDRQCLQARLLFLQTMGLAESFRAERWQIRSDFETVLRTMQRTADRQRALAVHAALLSDARLPSKVTNLRSIDELCGRVLGHTEDETTGRAYLMLEGTDHQIHFIDHSFEIEQARQKRQLRPNSFVRFRNKSVNGERIVVIEDFGDGDKVLSSKQHLRSTVRSLLKRGVVPAETGVAGWLGKYEAALVQTATELQAAAMAKTAAPWDRGR
jgi:type IV secretory pathway VirD2 relaxase